MVDEGREAFDIGNRSDPILLVANTTVGVFAKRKLVIAAALNVAVRRRRRH